MSHLRRIGETDDDDPLQGVANLFDLGIVFALGFLLALISYLGADKLLASDRSTTVTQRDGRPAEIIHDDGKTLQHFRISDQATGGNGVRLGTAYRLETRRAT